MSLLFSGCAAVVAGACAWPASAMIEAVGPRIGAASSQQADRVGPTSDHRRASAPFLLAVLLAATVWGMTLRLHPAMVAAAACWLTICGVPLAAVDFRVRRLPNRLTAASLAGVLGALALAAVGTTYWPDFQKAVVGGLAAGGFFGLLALTRPSSAGLGDAKLALSTGALAGWFGLGVALASVVAAFVFAAVYGLWLVANRRAKLRRTSLPFGPFLLAGCLTVILLVGTGHTHHVVALAAAGYRGGPI